MTKTAPTINVKIVGKRGAWILQQFHKTGSVVKCDAFYAKNTLAAHPDYEVTTAEAKADSTTKIKESDDDREAREAREAEARNKDASELHSDDCPQKEDLHKAGITTRDQLVKFIADNGDAWFKKITGIGPAGAKDIAEFLAKK